MKATIRGVLRRTLGITVFKKLPFGLDPLDDLIFEFGQDSFKCLFDVGANVGQTAIEFRQNLKGAKIYSFEPFTATFEQLKKNTAGINIVPHKVALGAELGELEVQIPQGSEDSSTLFSLKSREEVERGERKETIQVETLDHFCQVNHIETIDILKIDTEGFDLEVIKGGMRLIQSNHIRFIIVEAGMNPENDLHVHFSKFMEVLEPLGYRIFGIYDQVQEWPKRKAVLRRSNILFVSEKVYSQHKAKPIFAVGSPQGE